LRLFLNCTKNTELTAEHFLRKVTFAPQQNLTGSHPRKPVRTPNKLFAEKNCYRVLRAMKSTEWKTYRTRFLVKAKQLNSSLSFVDPLGRQHIGRKGDYLVESSEGVLSIAPRQIFEDIYVAMLGDELAPESPCQPQPEKTSRQKIRGRRLTDMPIVALEIEEVRSARKPMRRSVSTMRDARLVDPARDRKLPQPCRDRRAPAQPSRLNLM